MMKYSTLIKSGLVIFATVFTTTLFAQSTKNINVSNFNSVGVSSGIDLHLIQGNTESLVIKGDNDVIKDVVVTQEKQAINIKYKSSVNLSRILNGTKIDVYLTFKTLNALAASGGSDIDNTGTIKLEKLSLATSGGSDVDLNIICKNISIATSGGSDVQLKGSAENMTINSSGGSDIDAYDFKVNYAQVNSSGGSDVNVYVNKGLTASASGGSDITYKGSAAVKRTSSSKSGEIKHIN